MSQLGTIASTRPWPIGSSYQEPLKFLNLIHLDAADLQLDPPFSSTVQPYSRYDMCFAQEEETGCKKEKKN